MLKRSSATGRLSAGGAFRFKGSELQGNGRCATVCFAMRPLLPLFCLLLPACGNLHNLGVRARAKQQEKELSRLAEAATTEVSGRLGEKAVGEVAYVDADGGYVLVRARSGLALPPAQELQCQGSSARLKVSPERKNTFVAADIMSGIPQKGESVISVKSSAKPMPKLVPVSSGNLPGSNAPENTLYVDPSSIRPEDLPKSTLDEPGGSIGSRMVDQAPANDAGNLLVEPPLPDSTGAPLLPAPKLNSPR